LLAGMTVTEVATRMGLHPYTVTRWKRDPRFQAELRRQVSVAIARQSEPTAGATRRNTAQQKPTVSHPAAQKVPNAVRRASLPPGGASTAANTAGLPRAHREHAAEPRRATKTNTAQQKPTTSTPPAQNKPKPGAASSRYSDDWIRAILAGLPRPGNTGRDP
jgi:hypothetical protein